MSCKAVRRVRKQNQGDREVGKTSEADLYNIYGEMLKTKQAGPGRAYHSKIGTLDQVRKFTKRVVKVNSNFPQARRDLRVSEGADILTV
jgi:hypothetical protein